MENDFVCFCVKYTENIIDMILRLKWVNKFVRFLLLQYNKVVSFDGCQN